MAKLPYIINSVDTTKYSFPLATVTVPLVLLKLTHLSYEEWRRPKLLYLFCFVDDIVFLSFKTSKL